MLPDAVRPDAAGATGGAPGPEALAAFLAEGEAVLRGAPREAGPGPLAVGVDLGTAYVTVMVLDRDGWPVAGACERADVVRDGIVFDYAGAIDVVTRLKGVVEARLGRSLGSAAACYPPGVPVADVRATGHVLEAAGLTCSALVDELAAANAVLGLRDGAVVDVGGGSTGVAVLADGELVHLADEPTGGTHLSLVIAGALGIPVAEAERRKHDPDLQAGLLPLVRPVMEKIASITARHVGSPSPPQVVLVGGTCAFPGMADVVGSAVGVPTSSPPHPHLVTPLGTARHDRPAPSASPEVVTSSSKGYR